jgi:hypothetical protein
MKRSRRILLFTAGAGIAVAAAGSAAAALSSSPPGRPTAACTRAVNAQNDYIGWVETYTLYPDDSVEEGQQILNRDNQLLTAVGRAGCAPSTLVSVLPGT